MSDHLFFPLITSVMVAFATIGSTRADEWVVGDADQFHSKIKSARPGDVIVLSGSQWKDVELVADATGTAEAPITIRAQQPGKVTISGNSRLRIAGSHVVVSGFRFERAWHKSALIEFRRDSKRAAENCRLTDCEIVDCEPPNGERSGFKYISIYGRRNTVDHCRLSGKTNEGTTLVVWLDDGGDDEKNIWGEHTIRDNHFGPRPVLGRNGGETIRIGDSVTSQRSTKTIVEANLFEECNGEGEIVSNKSCDNVYRRNVFLRCSGALTLRHGHRCLVEQNLFLGEKAHGSGGVRIIGRDHVVINNYFERLEGKDERSGICIMNGIVDTPASGYEAVERAVIAHNTFYDCKRTILIGRDNETKQQLAPEECVIANNVIVSRRGPLIDLQTSPKRIQWHGNFHFGKGELGIKPRNGVVELTESPLEERFGRWTLFEKSPLIDAGNVLPRLPKFDLSGRPRDQSPDVGCDEWPLEKSDPLIDVQVGPTWAPTELVPTK